MAGKSSQPGGVCRRPITSRRVVLGVHDLTILEGCRNGMIPTGKVIFDTDEIDSVMAALADAKARMT